MLRLGSSLSLLFLFPLFFAVNLAAQSLDYTGERVAYIVGDLSSLDSTMKEVEANSDGTTETLIIADGGVVRYLTNLKGMASPKARVATLQTRGVQFEVCAVAVKKNLISKESLLPGIRHLDSGAPPRIQELRSAGYTIVRR